MVLGLRDLGVLAVRVLLALSLSILLAPQFAFANLTDEEYWNNTRINSNDVSELINTQNCYKNENNFLGCIAAINALLETSTPTKILSNKQIQSLSEMKETVTVIGGVQIKIFEAEPKQTKNLSKAWSKFTEKREQINKSWKGLYSATRNNPVSIEPILNYALQSSVRAQDKIHLANAINNYYKNAVDPHTFITPLAKFQTATATSETEISGIGTVVRPFDQTFLLSPMEESAALKAGVLENDVLLSVNGKSVVGLALDETIDLIKGPAGTSAILGLSRKGKNLEIEVIRSVYVIKNITGKLMTDPITKRKIGHIKLNSFMEKGVCNKFVSIAKDLRQAGAELLILDLRDNGGGLVNEAVCIASSYLDKGQTVITENDPQTNAIKKIHKATNSFSVYKLYNNKPLFILQNHSSASASEMLAGALSTYYKAIVIGTRSYGKGTMQESEADLLVATYDGFVKRKTAARFHFASGTSNQIVGVLPDIEAFTKAKPTADDKFALREVDQYPNAIAPSKPLNGFPERGILGIKSCMEKRSEIAKHHDIDLTSGTGYDYQLHIAREAAACQLEHR